MDLERAQIELLYTEFDRREERDVLTLGWVYEIHREATRKGAYIEGARAFCQGAVEALQRAGVEVAESLLGTPAEESIRRVNTLIAASSDELNNSLRSLGEFLLVANHQHSQHALLYAAAERVRQCLAGLEECCRAITSCQEEISSIELYGPAHQDLASLLIHAQSGVESCLGASLSALQILDDYRQPGDSEIDPSGAR